MKSDHARFLVVSSLVCQAEAIGEGARDGELRAAAEKLTRSLKRLQRRVKCCALAVCNFPACEQR